MSVETMIGFRTAVESIHDGVVIHDKEGRIVYVNPAFEKMTGFPAQEFLGRAIRKTPLLLTPEARKAIAERVKKRLLNGKPSGDLELEGANKEGERLTFSYSASTIRDEEGEVMGEVVVVRDITKRKKLEEEREQLIQELQESLAKVETLSGLIPICAWCKKIRDDKGYWQSVEQYIQGHSKAEFTHGMCPECQSKYFAKHSSEEANK